MLTIPTLNRYLLTYRPTTINKINKIYENKNQILVKSYLFNRLAKLHIKQHSKFHTIIKTLQAVLMHIYIKF